jgi:PAS domain S-box-containing protein
MGQDAANAFSASTAIFVFDESLRVQCWNPGMERLTGTPAEEAIGRRCWEVVGGHDDRGNLVCHEGCSRARIVREGRCVPALELHARTAAGRRRLSVETITAPSEGGRLFLHVVRDAPAAEPSAAPPGPPPKLTPRQRQILGLLAAGTPVKTVARELGLRETTVRNHIRLLFAALGAHSQLEAVARARACGIV